jgi:hypothetical protein
MDESGASRDARLNDIRKLLSSTKQVPVKSGVSVYDFDFVVPSMDCGSVPSASEPP